MGATLCREILFYYDHTEGCNSLFLAFCHNWLVLCPSSLCHPAPLSQKGLTNSSRIKTSKTQSDLPHFLSLCFFHPPCSSSHTYGCFSSALQVLRWLSDGALPTDLSPGYSQPSLSFPTNTSFLIQYLSLKALLDTSILNTNLDFTDYHPSSLSFPKSVATLF